MLLMDAVNLTATLGAANGHDRHPTMAIYVDLGRKLAPAKGPPPARFVFDQNAIRTATELTLGRPKVFREVMRNSHVPYPALWVEWEDIGRAQLREKFRQPEELDKIRPYPERFGFLIEADESRDYRAGKITYAWTQKESDRRIRQVFDDSNTPNVSAVTTYFDLDADYPIDFIDRHPLQLAELWADNVVQKEAFESIWRTAFHRLNEPAVLPIISAGNEMMRENARALLFADVVGEYIMTWACLLVLAEARHTPIAAIRQPRVVAGTAMSKAERQNISRVVLRSVDMSKLNKHRLRGGKIPLLDHRTVHVNPIQPTRSRDPLDYRRKSPRIHLVSSYLGWHGKIVFPYTRGSGAARR